LGVVEKVFYIRDFDFDLKDRIIMITGANSGIGKYTSIELAKMGAQIIMMCRNKERGEEALKEIKKESNSQKVDLFLADLSDQESLRTMVKKFKQQYDQLHVLINNAGAVIFERQTTEVGYEMTFAVNYLGHFLLTHLLLDYLIQSAPSRIINVSSMVHRYAKLDLDNIHLKKNYKYLKAYSNSKLALILFTYKLARKLEGKDLTVNALHPGVVRSNLGMRDIKWYMKPFYYLGRLFMKSSHKGAETSVYLAGSPEVQDDSEKYFVKCEPKKSSKKSYNRKLQDKLWNLSKKMTEIENFVEENPDYP